MLGLFAAAQVLAATIATALLTASAAHAAPRLGVWSEKAQLEWWRAHPGRDAQIAGTTALLDSLRGAQQQHGVERVFANKHFTRWLTHLRWLSLYPVDPDSDRYFSQADAHAAFLRASATPGLSDLLARSLSTRDDGPRVLETLCRIAAVHPEDLARFPDLAVAFAVVWDQPFPDSWPHPNVDSDAIPVGDADPAARFAYYVGAQSGSKLMIDPRSLSVRELTFVVDTPVELRELAYVSQVKLANISKLESLYRAIAYDHARIAGKNYTWPGGRYRLIDIGKKGGICMDQAYFVAHAGKAKGIPTVLFRGQGRSGDHAWVGFLTGRGRWTLDAAKWRGENYPTGHAYDPQTWDTFTDSQMEYAIKGQGDSPSVARGRLILGWAALNREQPFYPELLRAAAAAMPRAFEPWILHSEWLTKHQPDKRQHRQFWERWVANFAGERDMKARGQRALLRVMRELGDESGAERLGKQIVAENKSKRFDLGIAVAADTVFAHQEGGDWTSAAKEYERVMKRFKRDAGGHLFYNLVQPYTRRCLSGGKPEQARTALALAGDILQPQAGSILANDLQALRDELP